MNENIVKVCNHHALVAKALYIVVTKMKERLPITKIKEIFEVPSSIQTKHTTTQKNLAFHEILYSINI